MIFKDTMECLRRDGLVIHKNEDFTCWRNFKEIIDQSTTDFFEKTRGNTKYSGELNSVRLNAFRALNAQENWDKNYYKMAKSLLDALFGPDLLIQRKLNLSIQMPHDKSSILGMHTDTLSGQSPFEFVMWTAFTKGYDTNSMFYFDRETSKEIFHQMKTFEIEGLEALRQKYWSKANFLNVDASDVVLFSGTLFHGNVVNETNDTRISINCRFKNLFTPSGNAKSADRGVGIFYKLLSESVATEIGREYLSRDLNFEL
jgi:sporadic carbohydrate cluster 2OG-Fe(II) oxygenase